MWVWYIQSHEAKILKDYCKRYGISQIFVSHQSFLRAHKTLKKLEKDGIKVIPMIGDTGQKLSAKDIQLLLKQFFELGEKVVHFDLELGNGKIDNLNNQLKNALYYAQYDLGMKAEVDVEWWILNKEYKQIVKDADEWYLMNYCKTIIGTLFKALRWRCKPFHMGVETNPEFEHVRLIDYNKKLPNLHKWSKILFRNYKGISLHHWATMRDDKIE